MADIGNSAVFFQVDDDNVNTGTGPGFVGSMPPSTLDNNMRRLQGAIARDFSRSNPTLTAGGSGGAYTLTYTVAPAAYYDGEIYSFIANHANTGTDSVNINGLGVKSIKTVVGGAIANLYANDITAGAIVSVARNAANDCFLLVSGPRSEASEVLVDSVAFGAVVSFTINATTITKPFKRFELYLFEVSHNTGAAQNLRIEVSGNNGVSWSSPLALHDAVAAATVFNFGITIARANELNANRPIISSASGGVGTNYSGNIAVATGYINAIRISLSAGAYDGGNLTVIGYN